MRSITFAKTLEAPPCFVLLPTSSLSNKTAISKPILRLSAIIPSIQALTEVILSSLGAVTNSPAKPK